MRYDGTIISNVLYRVYTLYPPSPLHDRLGTLISHATSSLYNGSQGASGKTGSLDCERGAINFPCHHLPGRLFSLLCVQTLCVCVCEIVKLCVNASVREIK